MMALHETVICEIVQHSVFLQYLLNIALFLLTAFVRRFLISAKVAQSIK